MSLFDDVIGPFDDTTLLTADSMNRAIKRWLTEVSKRRALQNVRTTRKETRQATPPTGEPRDPTRWDWIPIGYWNNTVGVWIRK